MQAPKSPEKQVRARKTEKPKTVSGSVGCTTKDVEADTNKVIRLRQQRVPRKAEIKPKTSKKKTDQKFYNEEQSEDSSYGEDDLLYPSDDFSVESSNNVHFRPRSNFQSDSETKSKRTSYPDLINKMLVLCANDKDFIKGTCAGRIKSHYQRVFQTYKDKMEPRDRAIVNSGLNYIYNFNRSNSIPKENAVWLISINDIPISHIVSYTSKNVLKEIAKDYGISCSNKKAEELVTNIREAVEKN